MTRVFVSHSSSDAAVADAIVSLLRSALRLPSSEILCTSVASCSLPPWVDIRETLRREIVDAQVFLALVSQNSLESRCVTLEVGARWGANKTIGYLILPDVDSRVLTEMTAPINHVSCHDPAQVGQFVIHVAKELHIDPETPPAYGTQVAALVKIASASCASDDTGRIRIETFADGDEIDVPSEAPLPVCREVKGRVAGITPEEIADLDLRVEVSIVTDRCYPQGTSRVRPDGAWRIRAVHISSGPNILRASLRTKAGEELGRATIRIVLLE